MSTFWLSFCDPDKPAGSEFLGVAIVSAADFWAAKQEAWRLGINPGGEVQGWECETPAPLCWMNRLLSKADVDELERTMTA